MVTNNTKAISLHRFRCRNCRSRGPLPVTNHSTRQLRTELEFSNKKSCQDTYNSTTHENRSDKMLPSPWITIVKSGGFK